MAEAVTFTRQELQAARSIIPRGRIEKQLADQMDKDTRAGWQSFWTKVRDCDLPKRTKKVI